MSNARSAAPPPRRLPPPWSPEPVLATAASGLLLTVVWIRIGTDWAVPGWATYAAGLLAVILVQAMLFLASAQAASDTTPLATLRGRQRITSRLGGSDLEGWLGWV